MPKKELAVTETEEIVERNDIPISGPNIPAPIEIPTETINQGTIAIEASRAVAEAQGKLLIAKKFPRDEIAAYSKAIEACRRENMAKKAFYAYPRGGQTVEGPTIRFAEELARCWGNIDYGIKELSQDSGKSELQAYAWDLETNAQSVQNFTNPHVREVRGKMQSLTSQRDIYEANANMATRRMRARILAILPAWFVEGCITECKKTIAGRSEIPLIDRVKNLVINFKKYGVSQEMIERRLKRKVDTMTGDDFAEYVGIYNAIKEGESKVAEWFSAEPEAKDLTEALKGD